MIRGMRIAPQAVKLAAGLLRLARGLFLAAGALFFLVTFTPAVPWTAAQLQDKWSDSDGDVLIVLAGSSIEAPEPSRAPMIGFNSYRRAAYAAAAWKGGHFRKLLVCGSGSLGTMKPFLVFLGVPESAILAEDRSRSTRENALFAKPLLAGLSGKFVLLTSDYHAYRAARCFARAGIPAIARPIPDVLKDSLALDRRWDGFLTVSAELSKIVYYRARGWM